MKVRNHKGKNRDEKDSLKRNKISPVSVLACMLSQRRNNMNRFGQTEKTDITLYYECTPTRYN